MPYYENISGYSAILTQISSYLLGHASAEFSRGREPFEKGGEPEGTQTFCSFNPDYDAVTAGNSEFDYENPTDLAGVLTEKLVFFTIPLEGAERLENVSDQCLVQATLAASYSPQNPLNAFSASSIKNGIVGIVSYLNLLLGLHGQRRRIMSQLVSRENVLAGFKNTVTSFFDFSSTEELAESLGTGDGISSFPQPGVVNFKSCVAWTVNNFDKTTLEGFLSSLNQLIYTLDNPVDDPEQLVTPVSLDEAGTRALLNQLERLYNKVNNEDYIIITRLYEIVDYSVKILNRIHELRSAELKEARVDSKRTLQTLGNPIASFYYEVAGVAEDAPNEDKYGLYAVTTNEFLGKIFRDYQLPMIRLVVDMSSRLDYLNHNIEEVARAIGGNSVSPEEWAAIKQQREDAVNG